MIRFVSKMDFNNNQAITLLLKPIMESLSTFLMIGSIWKLLILSQFAWLMVKRFGSLWSWWIYPKQQNLKLMFFDLCFCGLGRWTTQIFIGLWVFQLVIHYIDLISSAVFCMAQRTDVQMFELSSSVICIPVPLTQTLLTGILHQFQAQITTHLSKGTHHKAGGINTWFTLSKDFLKSPPAVLNKIKRTKHLHLSWIHFFLHSTHLSNPSNQILHQLASCFSGERPPRLCKAVCASLISHLRYHITMSGLQGLPHPQQILLLLFFLLAGSDRLERSKFASSKSELLENVDCNAVPSAYAIHWDWGL